MMTREARIAEAQFRLTLALVGLREIHARIDAGFATFMDEQAARDEVRLARASLAYHQGRA